MELWRGQIQGWGLPSACLTRRLSAFQSRL